MKLPVLMRRWLPKAKFAHWDAIASDLEKKLKANEEELALVAEAQGWELDLGDTLFLVLPGGMQIAPRSRGGFDKRPKGGTWTRLDARLDIPESDLIAWQMCGDVFGELAALRQAVADLPGAVAESRMEFEQQVACVREAKSASARKESLARLKRYCQEQEEFLPASCQKILLDLERLEAASAAAPPGRGEVTQFRAHAAPTAAVAQAAIGGEDQILKEAAGYALAAAPAEVERLMGTYPKFRARLQIHLDKAQKRFDMLPEAMLAMENGDFPRLAELYAGDLEYADNLIGLLEGAFQNFLESSKSQARSARTVEGLRKLRDKYYEVKISLQQLQSFEKTAARVAAMQGMAQQNVAAMEAIELAITETEQRARGETRTRRRTATRGKSGDTDTGSTSIVNFLEQEAQALQEIKDQCEKAETWDDIKAIQDSFIFYHEFSENTRFRRKRDALVASAGRRIKESTRLVRKPGSDTEVKRDSLAAWAGVQEEQYVNLAIVFTDMIGSTALNARFGDEMWDEIRSAHFAQARTILDKVNGWYIKDVGDAVVAVFKNAVDALSFAMELEKNPGHETVRIKASTHIGTVIIRNNDIFGNEVNLASRIQGLASDGGVWMSEGVRTEWRSRHGKNSLSFNRHPEMEVKGLEEPITLWSIPPSNPLPKAEGKTSPGGLGGIGKMFGSIISRKQSGPK